MTFLGYWILSLIIWSFMMNISLIIVILFSILGYHLVCKPLAFVLHKSKKIVIKYLFDMGITFCPDYCVNAGGVIILALRSSIKEDMEYLDTEAKNKLIGIKNQLIKILTLSKEKNQLTTVSSNELAEAGFQ